jgi:hypothetical protein
LAAGITIFLKGFEDGKILCGTGGSPVFPENCRTENAPLRRKCDSVFDNKVERASRERKIRA